MSVLSALAGRHTTMDPREVDILHRLLGEWQLLADLSFADLLLWGKVVGDDDYVVLAQVRPYPAQTLYLDDMVGRIVRATERRKVGLAFTQNRIVREGDPEWREGIPIREETVPVPFGGTPIAVISIEQNLATARTPSHLELSYLRAAGDLEQMIAEGTFPFVAEEQSDRELSPRVGDGFLSLDREFKVTYASPNAVSAYRRLGVTSNLVDSEITATSADHRHVVDVLAAGRPVEDEVERGGAFVLRRFIPVIIGGQRRGAIGLIRDVTESRRRDRLLSIKDATIREIHHRVKNNLQTVASLLRLQARRLGSPEAREALEESVRRISSIALVHETLSVEATDRVEFDHVAQRIIEMAEESLVHPERDVRFSLSGSAGDLPSDLATPVSMILTELIQNAVQHAFATRGGNVWIELKRTDPGLVMLVRDDGVGLPEGFDPQTSGNLGLQIVRTLANEIGASLDMRAEGGTCVELRVPVSPV